MPEPRYRARREPPPRRSDPRSRTRARARPASEERAEAARTQRPRSRRHRRSRAPLALLAIALVVALGGISAAALTLRPSTKPLGSAAGSGSADAATDALSPEIDCGSCHAEPPRGSKFSHAVHAKRLTCDDCHAAPAPSHYRAECSACHAPSRPFSKPKLTHPVFGAHTVATHSCDACHRPAARSAEKVEKAGGSPSCRSCHRNKCGKGVTTMAGCLKCHQEGTTDSWVRSASP